MGDFGGNGYKNFNNGEIRNHDVEKIELIQF